MRAALIIALLLLSGCDSPKFSTDIAYRAMETNCDDDSFLYSLTEKDGTRTFTVTCKVKAP